MADTEIQTTEEFVDKLQFLGLLPGPQKPFVAYFSANSGLVTSMGDLIDKVDNGTATRNDYIDVVKDIGATATGVALMAQLVGVTLLTGGQILTIGIGLAALDYADEHGYDTGEMIDGLNDMLNDGKGSLAGAAWGIADALSDLFNSAQGWMPPRRGDPLVLDIDGDGIETIQININSPILFDHDGDGIKTATGWVKSDDALLVFDRNANGIIDNGSELFGDQTIVNGVKATDGFAALSAEDTNNNGIFDINDINFNNVRLWQDLNQNGISETNELKTLTQAGIVSISLSSTQTNTVVNGGIQTAEGTFTKSDGTSGESATVDVGSLGNYIFDSNSFYREFTDTITLTEAASALPEMQGSGVVRDLREAASMQTTEGAALTNILTQYSSLTTHDEQIAFMDELLLAWGATSGFKDIATEATQHGYTLTTNLNAEQFSILNVLEQFNGKHFYRMPWESTENTTARLGMSVDETTKTISINMFEGQLSILEQAYQELVESVYDGLVMQTRLAPYLDSITINIDENGLAFDVAPMITQLEALQLTNPRDALIDQLELIQYAGKNFSIMGWNWSETLQTMITQIGTQVDVKAVFSELVSNEL